MALILELKKTLTFKTKNHYGKESVYAEIHH
jgi:hypothetical protein